jgi:hypothetical protein
MGYRTRLLVVVLLMHACGHVKQSGLGVVPGCVGADSDPALLPSHEPRDPNNDLNPIDSAVNLSHFLSHNLAAIYLITVG